MPRGDRLLIGFLCSVILFPILEEYAQVERCLGSPFGVLRGDSLLVSFHCPSILSPILEEYAQIEGCSRSSLRMPRGNNPLVGFHCQVVLALPIKDGTPVECCPRFSLSGSLLMCIFSYRTLRVAGWLSGRFFSLLVRFVPTLLNLIIALSAAFLLWREGISHFC